MTGTMTAGRNELGEALGRLARLAEEPQELSDALLTFHNGELSISLAGMQAVIPVQGSWEGQLRVPGKGLLVLGRELPAGDPLSFTHRDDRLFIGSIGLRCSFQDRESRRVDLPLNPSLRELLLLEDHYTEEEIESSGYLALVLDARDKRDEMLSRAGSALAPLRVTQDDLSLLAGYCLRR